MVVLTALTWKDTPFAAMAILLILVPIVLGVVLVIGSMGRFGRRAAVPYAFPTWLAMIFAILAIGLLTVAVVAVVGDERLAALPLVIVAIMYALVARRRRTVLVCRLMPLIVMLGIGLIALAGLGFGATAVVRGDEPLAGIGLMGIGLALTLTVLLPWWLTCRGNEHAHIGSGLALWFLFPWLIVIGLVLFVLVGGLTADDPDDDAEVVRDASAVATTEAALDDPTPVTEPEVVVATTEAAVDEPEVADPTPVTEPDVADPTVPSTAPPTTVAALVPLDPDCVAAAQTAGIEPGVIEPVWLLRMDGNPEWQSEGEVPSDLGPSITSYGAAPSGSDLIVLMMLDRSPVEAEFPGAGTQLGVGFTADPDAPLVGPGGFGEGFGDLWFLTPGGTLEGFDAENGFEPLTGGLGAIDGSCAVWQVPLADPPPFVRINNFWRVPTGATPTADDPTAFQASENYRLEGGVLAPI